MSGKTTVSSPTQAPAILVRVNERADGVNARYTSVNDGLINHTYRSEKLSCVNRRPVWI